MLAILQHCNAVAAEPRRPAPDRNVTVTQRVFLYRIGALQSAELEGRGQAARNENDWIGEIALVLVMVQRQPRAGPVPVDQAGVGSEVGVAGLRGRLGRRKEAGISGQGLPDPGSFRS